MNQQMNRLMSNICYALGFASIGGSIWIWQAKRNEGFIYTKDDAHAERFGIFIGLWAPTFFILSARFEEAALRQAVEGEAMPKLESEANSEAKSEMKPDMKPKLESEVKPEVKFGAKPEVKPEVKHDSKRG